MNIKELKEEIENLPDTFEVLVYNKGFIKISGTSIIFSNNENKDYLKYKGSFNIEIEK